MFERNRILFVFASFLLFTGSLFAQSNGTIKGVVKDPSGAILPGVQVTLTDKATQRVQPAITSEVGGYGFSAVPPGQYSWPFELPGETAENTYAPTSDVIAG